jgi:phosphate transport system substrate-binding protein
MRATVKIEAKKYVSAALVLCALLPPLAVASGAHALILQGSTTFNTTLVEPYGKEIERETGIQLDAIPNKSSLGLLSLSEGQADLAMISTALPNEVEILRTSGANIPFEKLKAFEIARVPAAFVVHPDNPVRTLSLAAIRQILKGDITNWSELGGADAPIRVVAVRPGGGVLATVEAALGVHVAAPDTIRVQVGTQIVKVVAQEPAALGITQLSIVRRSKAVELKTDRPIEQVLSLVSLGEPSPEARRIIEMFRTKAATAP